MWLFGGNKVKRTQSLREVSIATKQRNLDINENEGREIELGKERGLSKPGESLLYNGENKISRPYANGSPSPSFSIVRLLFAFFHNFQLLFSRLSERTLVCGEIKFRKL